jgi:hypothetical protein
MSYHMKYQQTANVARNQQAMRHIRAGAGAARAKETHEALRPAV